MYGLGSSSKVVQLLMILHSIFFLGKFTGLVLPLKVQSFSIFSFSKMFCVLMEPFCYCFNSRKKYVDLLELIQMDDLAMHSYLGGVELLIFTSKQLPVDSQSEFFSIILV